MSAKYDSKSFTNPSKYVIIEIITQRRRFCVRSNDNCQKIKLLKLYEMLRQETDEEHPMRTNDICQRLEQMGISCERRTLAVDIQTLNDVKALIKKLPANQREVVLMRFYEELSFKEIAEKTGVSINTSLGRMRYALINLRKLIQQHNLALVG